MKFGGNSGEVEGRVGLAAGLSHSNGVTVYLPKFKAHMRQQNPSAPATGSDFVRHLRLVITLDMPFFDLLTEPRLSGHSDRKLRLLRLPLHQHNNTTA